MRPMGQGLGVAPGGDSGRRGRPVSPRAQRRQALAGALKAIPGAVKARHAHPPIHAELVDLGGACRVDTVTKRMRESGVAAKTWRSTPRRAPSPGTGPKEA